eukprot:gene905-1175_t
MRSFVLSFLCFILAGLMSHGFYCNNNIACGRLTTFGSLLQRKQALSMADASKTTPGGKGPPKRKAPKDDVIQVNGRVVESLPNAMFRVEIEPSKQVVLATISGKIRKNFVRIIV